MKRKITLVLSLAAAAAFIAPVAAHAQQPTPTPKPKGHAPLPQQVSHTPPPQMSHTPPPVSHHTPPPAQNYRTQTQSFQTPAPSYTPRAHHTSTQSFSTPAPGHTPFSSHTPPAGGTPPPGNYHKSLHTAGSGTTPPGAHPGPSGPPVKAGPGHGAGQPPVFVRNTSFSGPRHSGGGGQVYTPANHYGGQWFAAGTFPGWNRNQVYFEHGHHYHWFNGGWLIIDNGWPAGYYAINGPSKMWNTQAILANMGYYQGPVDGVPGPDTRQAIADYQSDNNLPVDGHLNPPTQVSLGLEPPSYADGYAYPQY